MAKAQSDAESIGTDGSTKDRVAKLREFAATDPVSAQDAAWAWFERLGKLAHDKRDEAAAQLEELFATGTASSGLDGPTDGILVAPMIHPALDTAARALTKVWMPWQGKRFNTASGTGDNRMVDSINVVGRLLWPLYSYKSGDDGTLAFDFQTRVEKGAIEPAIDVLVIDYADVDENPGLIIKSIRDELVQIVPGAHLGRILHRKDSGYDNWGYFALRTDVSH